MADTGVIDQNSVKSLLAASSADGITPVKVYANPSTHRLLVDLGSGVTGPGSSTDNAIARWDGTTGTMIQNSVLTIADTTGEINGFISGAGVNFSGGGKISGINTGDVTIAAGATNQNINLIPAGTGEVIISSSAGASGTGEPFKVTTTTATGSPNTSTFLAPNTTTTQSVFFNLGVAASNYNLASFGFKYAGSGSTSNAFSIAFFGQTPVSMQLANGNLLLGTSTDSSNGRLQLATHTTITGGIGFGTDTGLYRRSSGILNVDGGATSDIGFVFRQNGTDRWAQFYMNSSTTFQIYNYATAAAALTFTATSNATFAGTVNSTTNKIGGTAVRGTTEGTNQVVLFDGTAPVGTLTNGVTFYSAAGEARVMDAAGNSTLLSPHDENDDWVFYSKNTKTGKVLKIDMERLMKALDTQLGGGYVEEYTEDPTVDGRTEELKAIQVEEVSVNQSVKNNE